MHPDTIPRICCLNKTSSTVDTPKEDFGERDRTSIDRKRIQKCTRRETCADIGLDKKNIPVVSIA